MEQYGGALGKVSSYRSKLVIYSGTTRRWVMHPMPSAPMGEALATAFGDKSSPLAD